MSKDELPSINDYLESGNLPSYKDFIEKEEELPSVEEYISESTIEEETQTIEDANGESFLQVTDVIQAPEWSELVRLVNDVRKDIPEVPEIRYYDEQLGEICNKISEIEQEYAKSDKIDTLNLQNEEIEGKLSEIESKIPTVKYYDHDINLIYDKITDIKEEISNLPEVKYYEEDLKTLKSRIEQVNSDIPTFPDWVQKVNEVPDFSWIGKTFGVIDDDFKKVQGHLDLIKEKIDREVNEINETIGVKEFEFKVDLKSLNDNLDQTNDRITETKDKIYKEIKESSIRIWELRNTFKDDDRKLKKSLTSEQNKLKQSLKEEIEKINEQSIKTDESILKFFSDLKETVDALPEVKYYDEEISSIQGDISSLKSGLKELNEISSLIKKDQKTLKENYLLNEPPNEKEEAGGQTDPLTPLDQKFATLDDLSNHYRLFINRVTTQLATMGGGGAGFIKDLDDVDISGLEDGYILKWDDPNNKWIVASGGNIGAGGTWGTDAVGIHTTKAVGINTDSAKAGVSLFVVGDIEATGNVNVAGTVTYEDVKNVDSIGIVTARSGIRIGAGQSVSAVSGIITYYGDGSQLTGIIAGVGIQSGSTRIGTGFTDFKFTGAASIVGSGATVTIDIPATSIKRQVVTASGITTNFTVTGGYTVGFIDVFLNGVKQRSGTDFTATNGTTVTMIPAINDGDVLELQIYENLTVAAQGSNITSDSVRDAIQGYYGYTTDYYTVGVANATQEIGAGTTTMIQPKVAETYQYMPTVMTGVNTNPFVGTGATIGTGQTQFSLAGLGEGASCIVRTALAFNPDDDNTNLDVQLKFTTNTATQGTGLTNFTIKKEQALIMNEGADQQYISENLFSFFVGETLEGTTHSNAGSFSIEVIPSGDGELEVLAVTVNVVA